MAKLKPSEMQTGLTKDQKEAVGLLSIGTFLEYFDLMLYVHMAVLLNEVFFPKTDPHTERLLAAFAFCSTYLLRPFGAIIFGWIGDKIGRKQTVIITTFLMSLSCFCMAMLPTYAEVGIIASIAVTVCRVIQGMSSMGEIVGAEIYLTESIRRPKNYPYVMLMALFSVIGGTAALGVATLVTHVPDFNWRYAFGFGAIVAIIGYFARLSLKEAPEFTDAKLRIAKLEVAAKTAADVAEQQAVKKLLDSPVPLKMTVSLFLMQCGWPICFYFVYVYCGQVLKQKFGYTSEEVIVNNFIVSMVNLFGYTMLTYLCSIIHPLKILKVKVATFSLIAIACPIIFSNIPTAQSVFLLQSVCMLFVLSTNPAVPVLYSHFPILKRFRYGSLIFAISRSIMHVVTGFGTVYLVEYLGNYGLWCILLPMCAAYWYGVNNFIKLEVEIGQYQ